MAQSPASRPSWSSSDDTTAFNLIVIVVGLAVLSYVLWMYHHALISAWVMTALDWQMDFIHHFTDRFDLANRQMDATDPASVTLRDLYGIIHAVGRFFRIPAAITIVALAIICTVRAAPNRFRRQFDLESLFAEQVKTFPTTAAFAGRRLRLVPPAAGTPLPADYALTPAEWISRFALKGGAFDADVARVALIQQLGPAWSGVEQASPTVRCMFVVFGLHLQERREDALNLLGGLSLSLAAEDPDEHGPATPLTIPAPMVSACEALLLDGQSFAPSRAIAAQHAYTMPAMMQLLNAARLRAGVLAPAQFAWLKLLDRPLWYALHSLGYEADVVGNYLHPNPRVEAAAARDHWAVERAVGRPVHQPAIDRSLEALSKVAKAGTVTTRPDIDG
jgi:intracellular multiplication protein IcmP